MAVTLRRCYYNKRNIVIFILQYWNTSSMLWIHPLETEFTAWRQSLPPGDRVHPWRQSSPLETEFNMKFNRINCIRFRAVRRWLDKPHQLLYCNSPSGSISPLTPETKLIKHTKIPLPILIFEGASLHSGRVIQRYVATPLIYQPIYYKSYNSV